MVPIDTEVECHPKQTKYYYLLFILKYLLILYRID